MLSFKRYIYIGDEDFCLENRHSDKLSSSDTLTLLHSSTQEPDSFAYPPGQSQSDSYKGILIGSDRIGPDRGLPCLALSCLVWSCLVLSCLVLSCLVLSCLALPCLALSYRIVVFHLISSCRLVYQSSSYFILSCRLQSCLVLSCPVLSYIGFSPVLSCLVLSWHALCPVLSCLVLPYPILYDPICLQR